MSLAWTLIDRDRRAEFGGSRKLAMSVLTDIPLSALMAPEMMVTQIGILIGLLSGKASDWAAHSRDVAGNSTRVALVRYRTTSLTGRGMSGAWVVVPSILLCLKRKDEWWGQ